MKGYVVADAVSTSVGLFMSGQEVELPDEEFARLETLGGVAPLVESGLELSDEVESDQSSQERKSGKRK